MESTTIRDRLEYMGLLFAVVPFYYLPRAISLRLGSSLGWFMAHFVPIRRQVAESNIQRAFPEKSRKEVKRIIVRTYQHFGRLVADFIRQDRYVPADMSRLVTPVNQHLLDEALSGKNGVVVLSGHVGNWELCGYWLAAMGYPLHAIHRPQNNPLVSKYMEKKRVAAGGKLISMFASISAFSAILQDGDLLFVLADQDARDRGVFVNFFDIPSSTSRGAAIFAQRLNAPIILVFPIRTPDNNYEFIFEQLDYSASGSGNIAVAILQQYMDRLQYYVRLHPEQYFWFHRRWKTQPVPQKSNDSMAPSLAGAPG
ncbi:MAG TPA: lysophospholipid acyltransferase family protein [bacterium]|nr:lysophospholipid acyltransferase family protein [bacterium]